MKQMYIYETTDLHNNKKYIGQHYGELDDDYFGSGNIIKRSLKKYGKENFIKKILYIASTREELNQKEKEFIAVVDAVHNPDYYNIHEGGSGGNTMAGWSEERKKEYSIAQSERLSGSNNGMYGKHHTEHTKQLISQNKNTDYMQTEEYKQNMSKAVSGKKNGMYGKHHTEESKKKMSESKQGMYEGEKNPMYGKTHTEEARQKISEAAAKKTGNKNSNHKEVNLYADSEHQILKYHFDTIQEALEFVGVKPTNYSGVNRAIKVNRIYKNYFWEIIKPVF